MKTTLGKLKEFNACTDRYKHLCECLKQNGKAIKDDTVVSILEILNTNGVEDAFWALRTQKYEDYCLVLADIAESVLHIFENKYPNDHRPRLAVQAIRDYKAGKISKEELKSAAAAAVLVIDVAAAYAAYAAYAAAAYAYAAYATAAYAAYATAAYAAYATAAEKKQWEKNEEILRKYLSASVEEPKKEGE